MRCRMKTEMINVRFELKDRRLLENIAVLTDRSVAYYVRKATCKYIEEFKLSELREQIDEVYEGDKR